MRKSLLADVNSYSITPIFAFSDKSTSSSYTSSIPFQCSRNASNTTINIKFFNSLHKLYS